MMPRPIAKSRPRLQPRRGRNPWLGCAPFALLASSAVACGGAPASPQAPASSAAPIASVALPPPPDLGPVTPPPNLVVSGTLPRLGASLSTVHGWTQLPMPQSEQITQLLTNDDANGGMGAVVDLDRPIDFALAVTGVGARLGTLVAVAAGVRDLDAAKAALGDRYRLVPGDNGALVIQGAARGRSPHGGGPDDDKSDDDRSDDARVCELAPSYGPSAWRLVCAWDRKSLAALGPWSTRGAPRATASTDAHVDVRMAPLKPTISEERRLFSILLGTMLGARTGLTGARELAQALGSDVTDFGMDLDTASLDVALSDPGGAATLTLRFGASTSALSRVLTANADRNGPPPPAFWQMPGDADMAVFDRGIPANELARARDLVLKVAADRLADDGVKDADRHVVVDGLGKLVSSAPMVLAAGADMDAIRKSLAAEKGLPDAADVADRREAARVSAEALVGWRVIEIDEPVAARADAIKAIAAAWPRVAAVYKAKGAKCIGIRTAPMPRGSSLPKDAAHYAVDVPMAEPIGGSSKAPAKAQGPTKPLVIDVFLVPDGARSWVGVGGDPALVSAKLQAAIAGTGDGLRSHAELATLKDATVGAGGFFTARSLPELAGQVTALGGGDASGFGGGADLFEGMSQLPHQMMTPIPFSLTSSSTAAGTVAVTLQVPRGTVDDVVVAATKYGF